MSMKAFKYRIEANRATIERLQWVLDRARELYNASLTERRDAYEMHVNDPRRESAWAGGWETASPSLTSLRC